MDFFPLPTGMAVLTGISIVVATVSHWRISAFWRASLVSAVATTVLFLFACIAQAGLPEPLQPLAVAHFAGFALLVAIVVGLAFSVFRRLLAVGA